VKFRQLSKKPNPVSSAAKSGLPADEVRTGRSAVEKKWQCFNSAMPVANRHASGRGRKRHNINMLDVRLSVAPMMDWTDATELVRTGKQLGMLCCAM
jgi:hypothetical protein